MTKLRFSNRSAYFATKAGILPIINGLFRHLVMNSGRNSEFTGGSVWCESHTDLYCGGLSVSTSGRGTSQSR